MNRFDRLIKILDGRKPYQWLKEIGIDRSAVRLIKENDALPNWNQLYAIRRAEGIRLEWLSDGTGEPFIVNRYLSEAECAESIAAHLEDEDWNVTLATDGQRHAAILTQPGSSTVEGRAGRSTEFHYTITEIMLGVGKSSLETIAEKAKRITLSILSSDKVAAIYKGEAGPYRLIGADDAWLKNAKPVDATNPIFSAEQPVARILTRDQENLLNIYEHMAAEQRATYKAIGDTLAQQNPKKDVG